MTRCKVVLPILVASILLLVAPCRVSALPTRMFLADVNGDGTPDKIEVLSEGTTSIIAVHVSPPNETKYRFRTKISPFGTVLAGDFDHDGDLDLVWLSGGGPGSVVLLGDGQGNFEFLDNTHLIASELRKLIDSGRKAGLESQQPEAPASVFTISDYSRDFILIQPWSPINRRLVVFPTQSADHRVRISPDYRLADRSPPQQLL